MDAFPPLFRSVVSSPRQSGWETIRMGGNCLPENQIGTFSSPETSCSFNPFSGERISLCVIRLHGSIFNLPA